MLADLVTFWEDQVEVVLTGKEVLCLNLAMAGKAQR